MTMVPFRRASKHGLCASALLLSLSLPGCVLVVHDDDDERGEGSYVRTFDARGDDGPAIGVLIEPANEALASQLGLDAGAATLVTAVRDGSPAQRAGLRRHDVVVAIEGREEAGPGRLQEAVRSKGDGEVLELRVYREGQPLDIPVEVQTGEG